MTDKPSPGSAAAVKQGCTCPILINQHGNGYMSVPDMFVLTAGCPVHDPVDKPADRQLAPEPRP